MSQNSFDEVLAQVDGLPISEQQRLFRLLGSKLSRTDSQTDRRAPLLVEQPDFSREMKWLSEHQREYAGQWVSLKEDRLIAHGTSAKEVFAASDAAGVEMPLVTRVDDPNAAPFAGV